MKFVIISPVTNAITGEFSCSQLGNPAVAPDPHYAEIADNDPRYALWQTSQQAPTTLAQKIAAGCQITSASRPYLNGTYAIDPTMQQRVQAVTDRLNSRSAFPHGGGTYNWPVIGAPPVTFKATADALDVFTAICDYVADCLATEASLAAGNAAAWPAAPAIA